MDKKWKVQFIMDREGAHSDTATNLEDALNGTEEAGFEASIMERDKGFFVIGRRPDRPALGEALKTVLMPLDKLKSLIESVNDPAFVIAAMSQVSAPNIEAAKKELPEIVQRMTKGMPVEEIKKLSDGCSKLASEHNHDGEPCVLGEVGSVVCAALKQQVTLNLQ